MYHLDSRKPITAEEEETDRNPRSRSAKLRAAELVKDATATGAPGSEGAGGERAQQVKEIGSGSSHRSKWRK
jgi:MraW methylase family